MSNFQKKLRLRACGLSEVRNVWGQRTAPLRAQTSMFTRSVSHCHGGLGRHLDSLPMPAAKGANAAEEKATLSVPACPSLNAQPSPSQHVR